ncbi:MAG: ComEA family DNA-binding protein [Oscillospiraceae bacterium]
MKLSRAEIASIVICFFFIMTAIVISVTGQASGSAALTLQSDPENAFPAPSGEQTAPPQLPVNTAAPLININTADAKTLCELPGVGASLAEKIISYRVKYGAFTHISNILDVSGIGAAKYEDIKNLITV